MKQETTTLLQEALKALEPFAALDDGDMSEDNEARRWPAIKVGWIRVAKAIIAKAKTDV